LSYHGSQNIHMKTTTHKIYSIFSIRNIAFITLASFLSSCATHTYPATHQGTPYNENHSQHVSDPTIPIIAGVATVGAIAYYANKKHDDRKKSRIRRKPIKKHYTPSRHHNTYASHRANNPRPKTNYTNHSSLNRRTETKPIPAKSYHRSTNTIYPTESAYNQASKTRSSTRNSLHNNRVVIKDRRAQSIKRQKIVKNTRNQLIRKRDGDKNNVTVSTRSNTRSKNPKGSTTSTTERTRDRETRRNIQ